MMPKGSRVSARRSQAANGRNAAPFADRVAGRLPECVLIHHDRCTSVSCRLVAPPNSAALGQLRTSELGTSPSTRAYWTSCCSSEIASPKRQGSLRATPRPSITPPSHILPSDITSAQLPEAIRLDPANVVAYADRAGSYSAKRDYDNVIVDYTQVLRFEPGNTLRPRDCVSCQAKLDLGANLIRRGAVGKSQMGSQLARRPWSADDPRSANTRARLI
jgi:hypothetical protein